MDQLYEMARTVVVVSSQLITTLSALAYLRNRNINGTDLRVLSLERLDHVHAAHPFEDVLIRLAARDGHRCVFGELSALPAEPEGLICDLLLLPRVDHKQGWEVLQRCLPDVVIELGGIDWCGSQAVFLSGEAIEALFDSSLARVEAEFELGVFLSHSP